MLTIPLIGATRLRLSTVQLRCLLAVLALATALPSLSMAQATAGTVLRGTVPSTVEGVVQSAADGWLIEAAVVVNRRSGERTRTQVQGHFAISAERGDTLAVRALGYREATVVLTQASVTVLLQPMPTVLPLLVTTVGQRVIRAAESSRSITVLGQSDIAAAAASGVNQLLRLVPGLQEIPAPPSKTSISIRGFDDARVLVLVDGEPVAGSLVESRDIGRLATLATERIEVTKGPSSVEFGSDALGGVINLVQAAPSEELTLHGTARVGELGRQEATAGVSQQVGRVGYRVSGGWRQSDRVTGFNAVGSTFNRLYDVRSDTRLDLGAGWTARLDLMGTQERQRFPLDAQFNGFIDNRGGQGFAELQGVLWGGTLRTRAFEQRFTYEYRQARGLLPIRGSADSVEQRERQSRQLVAYTRGLGAHTVDVGMQRSVRTLIAPTKVDGDSARDNVAEWFVRDSWALGAVSLSAGARHTASSLWGSSTNPSVGAVWQAAPTLMLRTNVARGFRAPGFKEIRYTFFNPAGGYTLIGNPELVPETSWSGTVGGSWVPASRLAFDLEVYRNDVDGLIDWQFRGNNAAGYQMYANVNVAQARTQGFESSARYRGVEHTVTLGYDHLRARDLTSGLPLSRRASHTARMTLAREWSAHSTLRAVRMRGLHTNLSLRYTGRAPLVGIPSGAPISGPFSTESGVIGYQGALLSVDAQMRWRVSALTELSVGVNNALNQQPALWTPAFARQVYAGLSLRWRD